MQHQRTSQARTPEASRQKSTAAGTKSLLPAQVPLHHLFQLQQAIGNQAVQRLLRSRTIQPKLAISQPGDIYEREADRVAEQVMRMPESVLQRACAPCATGGAPCPKCSAEKREELVQRKTEQSSNKTAGIPDNFLQNLGPGQPLDERTRGFFEPRFGRDFSRVRVHTDARAGESAQPVNARAYTIGGHIVFGSGEYAPATPEGRKLLAHELTHVVQQRSTGKPNLSAPLRLGEADDPREHEADRIADAVVGAAGPVSQVALVLDARGEMIQRKNGGGKAPATPSWTVDELKKMLTDCDGGLGIWAKAKKANKDKDPIVKPGKTSSGGVTSGDTITLEETSDRCTAVQVLIQELSNMSRTKDFDKLSSDALAGDLARDAFIKGFEKIEYESGVKNVLTAFDACKDTWKCKTAEKEWARKAKDFDEYFDKLLSDKHKEGYGTWWDKNCKAAYDKKHAKK